MSSAATPSSWKASQIVLEDGLLCRSGGIDCATLTGGRPSSARQQGSFSERTVVESIREPHVEPFEVSSVPYALVCGPQEMQRAVAGGVRRVSSGHCQCFMGADVLVVGRREANYLQRGSIDGALSVHPRGARVANRPERVYVRLLVSARAKVEYRLPYAEGRDDRRQQAPDH